MIEQVLRGRRVLTPAGIGPASVHIAGGRIAAVAEHDAAPAGVPVHDAGDALVMPGVVDTHVHVNEPGRTEWEGFATATRAAAAGGTTTIVDMPLNSIPATTTAAALVEKRRAAAGQVWVDVGFWGGVVPGNRAELAPLVGAGALGFKCFLIDSGVDEFPCVGAAELAPALAELAGLRVPLLAHAELAAAMPAVEIDDRYANYLASRPEGAEEEAIALLIALTRAARAHVHIVHHSAASALPLLAAARAEGLPITAETCPHYLAFAAEEVPDGATPFKCAPPIRGRANREQLWRALADGVLDMVASDHSPCTPALKRGDFGRAWGGIAGLQLALAATWTEAQRRGFGLEALARWMCAAPARLAGLAGRKGAIAVGRDADFAIWRPEERFVVERVEHRHPTTPWAGRDLLGVVEETWVRGRPVWRRGESVAAPAGALL
jgi:allantoinase